MSAPVAQPGARPWYLKRGFQVTGGIIAAVILIGVVTDNGDNTGAAADQPGPTTTVTVDPSGQGAPSRHPTRRAPSKKPAVQQPISGGQGGWTMPDEVGMDLQAAQDDIQGLTDNPFFFTASEDATGQDRFQILDVDWQVCGQRPAAGATFGDDTNIVFSVVKDTESCP